MIRFWRGAPRRAAARLGEAPLVFIERSSTKDMRGGGEHAPSCRSTKLLPETIKPVSRHETRATMEVYRFLAEMVSE